MNRREIIMIAVMFGLLIITVLWTYGLLADARSDAQASCEDLQHCRKLISAMEKSRHQPTLATDKEKQATETTSLIEKTAADAKIDPKSLIRITPEPARRIGETLYKEKPTMIFLKNVTLEQLVGLTHGLQSAAQPLVPKFIRIVAPQQKDTGRQWNAEISVTYLIYDPPASRTESGRILP